MVRVGVVPGLTNRALLLFALLAFTACDFYQAVGEMTEEGSYLDPEFGTFTTTLEFNGPDIQRQYSATDIARIASISVRTLREIGEELGVEEYSNIKGMLPCVQNNLVRVTTKESYLYFCPLGSIACNNNNIVYLKEGSSYTCLNTYTIGHEFIHSALNCLRVEGNSNHSAPGAFVWVDGQERVWNTETAEHRIHINPEVYCSELED